MDIFPEDQGFSRFKEFKALMEKQTGRKIQVLRSDNGGEYTDGGFSDFCAQEGIRREFTVPYNPNRMGCLKGRTKLLLGLLHR